MASDMPNPRLVSQELRNITDKMVFEGVTQKEGMEPVKVFKKLWTSDSFEALKSILEEDPIKEGRSRVPAKPVNYEVDGSLIESSIDAEIQDYKENVKICNMKETLRLKYEKALTDDLELLRDKTDEIIAQTLGEARQMLLVNDADKIEDQVKTMLEDMRNNIKCYKKQTYKKLKLAVRLNVDEVFDELKQSFDTDTSIRLKTYKYFFEKMHEFQIRQLDEVTTDEYQMLLSQKLRSSIMKFDLAMKKLRQKQDEYLNKLECKLETDYLNYKSLSNERVESMVHNAVNQINDLQKGNVRDDEIDDGYVLVRTMVDRMQMEGLLPYELEPNENWENVVKDMINFYQVFIELVLGKENDIGNNYFLSMNKLRYFKDKWAQITMKNLIKTEPVKLALYKRTESRLTSAFLLQNLMRAVIPSPVASRTSFSDIQVKFEERVNEISNENSSTTGLNKDDSAFGFGGQNDYGSTLHNTPRENNGNLELPRKRYKFSDVDRESSALTQANKPETFLKLCREDSKLFNLFFPSV